jgi:hypothetical protein
VRAQVSTFEAITTSFRAAPLSTMTTSNSILDVAAVDDPKTRIATISTNKKPVSMSRAATRKHMNGTKIELDADGIPVPIPISYPQVDFPFVFHKFVTAVSKSHPHIVEWSACGNYFRMDRNAEELPSLIRLYFQRKHSILYSPRNNDRI